MSVVTGRRNYTRICLKMFEYQKNYINDMNNTNNFIDENIPNSIYYRDYYLKDFKYISPEALNINKVINNDIEKSVVIEEEKSLLQKWIREVVIGVKQFFYQGSLHGVKYIFEPTFSIKEKLTWVLIMIISIIICAVIIIQLFCKWTSTPFVNVIDSVPTPIWAVPFPTVVLCPHLHVKLSYANVSELTSLQEFFASLVCPYKANENIFAQQLNLTHLNMMKDFLLQSSPTCPEVVKACNWPPIHNNKWEVDKCCDLFQPVVTNYGLCFAFNSLPLNAMTNDTLDWHRIFNPKAEPEKLEWSLDTGYPKTFPPDLNMKPFRVMASGEANGLGVELFLNNSEHQLACEGNSLGFTVLISSPTDHVYTSTVLRIPMDRMTTIEVTPLTYKTDSSLRSLAPHRRQCLFQNEKRLRYYEFYTDSNCKHDLLIREARRMCDCVLFNWPRIVVWEPVCSSEDDYNCINEVQAKVEEQLIYAYYAESEDGRGVLTTKSCHPSCNDIIYASQVFYSDLTKEMADAHQGGNLQLGEVTQINVHFYDDMFLGQHRHAQYDDYYFVGAIGGLLSLFLGFSIISVAELVYFVLLKPAYVVLRAIYVQ